MSSIEMEHIVLSALLSNFPDDSSGQLIAGASAATTSKAEMRARIEKWNVQETGLRNRILDIEHQLPVHAKTNAPLNLVKRPT